MAYNKKTKKLYLPVTFDSLRSIFFPKDFYEKYKYLGSIPHREGTDLFKTVYPLVLAMDYEAKPKGCPRWFLRFLHLFGCDNSIIRVRNQRLYKFKNKLTRGILMIDYKTKWTDYDLRISINGPEHLQNLARFIEAGYFSQGRQKELGEMILELDPNAKIVWGSVDRLVEQYNNLKSSKEIDEWFVR